jgi:ribonuclease HI
MFHVYFDGATNPNPGPMGIGATLFDGDTEVDSVHCHGGMGTNNQSEYLAMLCGVLLAKKHGVRDISIRGDSQLIINQMTGVWQCNQEALEGLRRRVQAQLREFDTVEFRWIRRADNERADLLSKKGLVSKLHFDDWVQSLRDDQQIILPTADELQFPESLASNKSKPLGNIHYVAGVGFSFTEGGVLYAVNLKPTLQCSCGEKQCNHIRKLKAYLQQKTKARAA